MRKHKVITSERNGVYKARCLDCEAITFGGFSTRTAAREAIASTHDADAEKTPDVAATTAEGTHPEPHCRGNETT